MKTMTALRRQARWLLLGVLATFVSATHGQTPLAWEQTKYFKYNIENVTVTSAGTGSWTVKVIFSVSDPTKTQTDFWDIKTDLPFKNASVTADIAWDSKEFTNTGSDNPTLTAIVKAERGSGAALPVQVRNLQTTGATACTPTDCPNLSELKGRYFVVKPITPVPFTAAVTTGRVAIEGRPVCNGLPNCPTSVAPFANIPVTSATADFSFTPTAATPEPAKAAVIKSPRRQIVDITKCQGCHDDKQHGDTVVPRLSLHGANRNQNLDLCVVCHNPNQTDVNYRYLSTTDARIGAAETPIDFKTMVHSIHAGGFRKTPFVVVGFNSSVNDFSGVRFPAELRKSCLKCHVEVNGKGSFELPLKSTVLGTTIKTQSTYAVALGALRTIDVDPRNDLKITPTAATCSGCHDSSEVRSHMIKTGGASFATTQDKIGKTVVERCASCHGPGKDKDVRKVHELSSSSSD